MALFKCPECGNMISDKAEFCPHCGYVVNSKNNKPNQDIRVNTNDTITYKDNSWIKKYKRKGLIARLICLFFILAFLISCIVTGIFENWILLCIFSGLLVGACLFEIALLLIFKTCIRNIDGYIVMAYTGFSNLLIIDGEVVQKELFNRYLYSSLPNGKQVWAKISFWDGSIKMGVGNDEHQII